MPRKTEPATGSDEDDYFQMVCQLKKQKWCYSRSSSPAIPAPPSKLPSHTSLTIRSRKTALSATSNSAKALRVMHEVLMIVKVPTSLKSFSRICNSIGTCGHVGVGASMGGYCVQELCIRARPRVLIVGAMRTPGPSHTLFELHGSTPADPGEAKCREKIQRAEKYSIGLVHVIVCGPPSRAV